MRTHKQFIKEQNSKLSKALNILYDVEDATYYKNRKLGTIINKLQKINLYEHD